MQLSKHIVIVGLAYSLAFGVIYSTSFVHRQAYDKAIIAWYKERTAENEAALQRERHINEVIKSQDSAVRAAILVVVGYGGWLLLRRAKRKLP